MLAPMAQCDAPVAAISVNTVAIQNVSREQAGAKGMTKNRIRLTDFQLTPLPHANL
jgi:hypothetical protein